MNKAPHFGPQPTGEYRDRPSAYGIILHEGKILTLKVQNVHLPGGAIDSGETPEQTVAREALEEAGCIITDITFVGKANQFFPDTETGSVYKQGYFFSAQMSHIDASHIIEEDHETRWLTPEEFLASTAGEYQKWAVKMAMKNRRNPG